MVRSLYPQVQETSTLSADGKSWLRVMVWLPDPVYGRRGVVQLVHGMAEHIERYDSFARFLAGLGYVVFGHDHIGHGKSVSSADELGCMPLEGGKDILPAKPHARWLVKMVACRCSCSAIPWAALWCALAFPVTQRGLPGLFYAAPGTNPVYFRLPGAPFRALLERSEAKRIVRVWLIPW